MTQQLKAIQRTVGVTADGVLPCDMVLGGIVRKSFWHYIKVIL